MSTSMQLRTADLPEEKNRTDVTTKSTSGKPRDRKRQEILTGCRTVTWQKRGTRSSRDPGEMRLPTVERRAARRAGRSQGRTRVRTGATLLNAFPAQRISECAIRPGRRRLPATRI